MDASIDIFGKQLQQFIEINDKSDDVVIISDVLNDNGSVMQYMDFDWQ